MKHVEMAVVSRAPGVTYGHMYSMHKYWSKKSPDVIAEYIDCYTKEGDIVIDPFCGSGIVACEAVRCGRRAIAIDINPVATFITRVTLTPVNLSRLKWAFYDVKNACETAISELFVTRCNRCGKNAVVEFIVRDGDVPNEIAYRCNCSKERLFKHPDAKDKRLDSSFDKKKIPFWYPRDVLLPIIQKEKFQFIHELFTKRNLIALSIILNAIEKTDDLKVRDVMKLAFSAALDKCSRLKPLSRARKTLHPSLSEGWVAVRFYSPRMWQEVNPWHAFARSFKRVYKGKKESNNELKKAVVGSSYDELRTGRANVVIFNGSADAILSKKVTEQSVDYVLTDPPFGERIQYLSLSTFWGAWLKFDFDYDRELVINRHQGKTKEYYERHLGQILKSIRNVTKPNKYIHIFYNDISGPYLHKVLKLMSKSKIVPERVLHQPPPNSFGVAARTGKGYYGSYIVRGKAISKRDSVRHSKTENSLQEKVAKATYKALEIRGGSAPVGTLLHTIYQKLAGKEILAFAQHPAEEFLKECIKEFATVNKTQAKMKSQKIFTEVHPVKKEIRKAILDAKALHGDQKNQIYQSVLRRFQEEGITLESIRKVAEEIQPREEKEHRKKRYLELLLLFGEKLGFKSRLANRIDNEVIWKRDTRVTWSFLVNDKQISVRSSRTMVGKRIVSDVGTISHRKFEYSLLKWCDNNLKIGYDLKHHLNPMPAMPKLALSAESPKRLSLRVFENKKLCPEHYLLTVQIPKGQNIEPRTGQFFHIICDPDSSKTLTDNGEERGYALTLRRPFSVHRIIYEKFNRVLLDIPATIPYEIKEAIERPVSKIDILYKVVGEGTKNLSKVRSGSHLDVIGPIGKGFDIEKVDTAVIVAGGIGVAPLVALAERLRYLGSEIFLYFGALRSELLRPILSRADSAVGRGFANGTPEFLAVIENEFKEIGAKQVRVCTDDGSLGKKGRVTDMLERDIKSCNLPTGDVTIYACGPFEMMKAVSMLAKKHKVPCQVLLEERMACGIGACFSCTCHMQGKSGKVERKRVCVDGPVFNSEEIKWPD